MDFLTVQNGIDRISRQYSRTIGEISPTLWLDFFNDLNRICYEGLAMIQPNEYITQTTFSLVDATQSYTLPSDLKWIKTEASIGGESGFYDTTTTTGSVTAMADAGGGNITVTADHTFINGDTAVHTGFSDPNHNGSFTVSNVVSGTSYEITATFTATGTGTWSNSNRPKLPALTRTGFGSTDHGYYLQGSSVYFTPTPTTSRTVILRYVPEIAMLTTTTGATGTLVIKEDHLEMVMNFLDKNYGQWNIDIFKENNGDARFARGIRELFKNESKQTKVYIFNGI